MIKEILIDTKPEQTRVAILEDGELAELHVESAERRKLFGNIYRGKIERVLPGMQCAFVDIGTGKNAHLSADDVVSVKNIGSLRIESMVKQDRKLQSRWLKRK